MKLTPVLYVEAIEPCVAFWERLGFAVTIAVAERGLGRLGFAALAGGGVEIMYQTRANLAHDIPAFAGRSFGPAVVYLEVHDLERIAAALGDAPVEVPRRKTSYGADELWVREPGGHVIGFAQR